MHRAPSTPGRMIAAVLVTCVISATALTFTYTLTYERILAQERAAEERAIKAVLSSAEEFDAAELNVVEAATKAAGDTPVSAIYVARDGSGTEIGWAVRVSPRGYGGPMNMVVGLDRDGKVTGASIITQNETPGLGTKILTEPGFLDQFAGWDGADIDRSSKSFDAISGATRSSNGVRAGVIAAGRVYADVLATGGGE